MSYSKDNLAWLGIIPDHWQVLKLRQILASFSEKNHPDMPLLSVVRKKGVIIRNVESKEENHNYVPDDLSNYKLVKQGQFAMKASGCCWRIREPTPPWPRHPIPTGTATPPGALGMCWSGNWRKKREEQQSEGPLGV